MLPIGSVKIAMWGSIPAQNLKSIHQKIDLKTLSFCIMGTSKNLPVCPCRCTCGLVKSAWQLAMNSTYIQIRQIQHAGAPCTHKLSFSNHEEESHSRPSRASTPHSVQSAPSARARDNSAPRRHHSVGSRTFFHSTLRLLSTQPQLVSRVLPLAPKRIRVRPATCLCSPRPLAPEH